jgi:YD repeat-containing protein
VSGIRRLLTTSRNPKAVVLAVAVIAGTLGFALSGVGASSAAASVTPTSGLGTGGPGPTVPANAVAMPTLWTANSRTYKDRPDGPYTTIFYTQPINVKGPEGAWRPMEGTTIPTEPATAGPARPPHIDASVTVGASQDCPIESNHATESLCSSTSDKVGWDTVDTDNTLIQFNIKEALSPDANVLNAQLGMYLSGSSTSNSVSVSAYAVLKPWTTSATWNTYDGTHAWTEAGAEKAGSDYTTTNTVLNPSVVAPAGWAHWYPTQIVQEWANGTLENRGLVLADTTQRKTNDALTFNSSKASSNKPYLTISWTPRGQEDPPAYTMQPFPIDETSTMKVNLASGDLFVNSNDLSVTPKAGPPLLAEHNYDSRNTEGGTVNPWYSLPGASVYADGSVAIGINRYDFEPFIRQSNGTFLTPRGIHATLCEINETTCKRNTVDVPNKGKYALTFNENGTTPFYREGYKIDFGENGGVWSIADPEGHAIAWNYEGKLTLKDGEGHTFTRNTATVNGFTVTSSWVESGGGTREVKYAYNSGGKLETYTDAESHKTKYVYDTDGELSEITAPSGTVTKLYYTADTSRRITKIEGAEENGSKGTWEYTYYEVGKAPAPCTASQKATVVTETNGNEEPPITYCSNVWDEVEQVSGYPKTGQPGQYVKQEENIGENRRETASVNLASGNLLVESQEIVQEAANQYMMLRRYYNSQATQTRSSLGSRWRWGTGPGVYLVDFGSMIAVHGPSGYIVLLNRTPTGTYTAPPLFEGTVTKNANGSYTVATEDNRSGSFNSNGVLTSETSEVGNVFTVGDTTLSGKRILKSLAPASGKPFEATYDATPHVTETMDPASGLRHYEYDASGRLKTYTDPSSAKTEYAYNASGLLEKIAKPEGMETVAYSGGKVSEVTSTVTGGEPLTTKFTYQAAASPPCNPPTDVSETIVTYPEGAQESLCFTATGEFTGPFGGSEAEEPEEHFTGSLEAPTEWCEEDPELHKADCGLEEGPPDPTPEEDLPRPDYGIADNTSLTTGSPPIFNYFEVSKPFQELKVVKVRRTVPWNLVWEVERYETEVSEKKPGQDPAGDVAKLQDLEKWIAEAKRIGAQPYIGFDDQCNGENSPGTPAPEWFNPLIEGQKKPCAEAPSKGQYKAAVERFLKPRKHPTLGEVHNFEALNEPNLRGMAPNGTEHVKPTWSRTQKEHPAYASGPGGARLAGEYWRALNGLCSTEVRKAEGKPECFVAAGDFLDTEMPEAKHSVYFSEYKGGMGKTKGAWRWGWHAYRDGEVTQIEPILTKEGEKNQLSRWWGRFKSYQAAVDEFMHKAKYKEPDIWLTEQGVVFFRKAAETQAKPWRNKRIAEGIMNAYVKAERQLTTAHASGRKIQIRAFFYYALLGAPKFDSGLLEAETLPSGEGIFKRPFLAPKEPRENFRIYKQKTPG